MKTKKKKIVLIVLAAILILILISSALFYFLFFRKLEGTPVDFNYNEYVFTCPDFKSGSIVEGENSLSVFNNLIAKLENDTQNWCYIGMLSGYGAFSESAVINNTGLEIVKRQGSEYYQLVRTHSNGKILAPISINSAQRSHIDEETLSVATVSEETRFSEGGEIDWKGISFEPIYGECEVKRISIVNSVQFIAEEKLISDSTDENVYEYNGKRYLELTLDLSSLNMQDLLDILTGKVSNKAMNLGMELFSPEKMTVDMSQIDCKFILEFEGEGENAYITGRSFTMKGKADIKGLLTYNMTMDIAMNAVVLYIPVAYTITDSDLLI